MMSDNINRIMAQHDLRDLRVNALAQATEQSLKEGQQQLVMEVGMVMLEEESLDKEGLHNLKDLE